jgi:hypothetical protein
MPSCKVSAFINSNREIPRPGSGEVDGRPYHQGVGFAHPAITLK